MQKESSFKKEVLGCKVCRTMQSLENYSDDIVQKTTKVCLNKT